MPIRKKGGKKKKSGSGKKSRKSKSPTDGNLSDPQTMMSDADGTALAASGGKKKKKKTKLTKAEKEKAKLDKKGDALKKDPVKFNEFVDRMDNWFKSNAKRVIDMFRKVDADGDESVSFADFKAGLFDLNAPVNQVETHVLCQILEDEEDEAEERIPYEYLNEGLAIVREREMNYQLTDIRPSLKLTQRQFDHCPCCKMQVWHGECYKEEFPRYVELNLKLIPFMHMKRHPGNFTKIVHSHITTLGIIRLIQEETFMETTRVYIYWQFERNNPEHDRNPTDLLAMEGTLEDMGIEAGPRLEPEPLMLYYDYKVDFTECPILMADHYLGKYKQVKSGEKTHRARTPRD